MEAHDDQHQQRRHGRETDDGTTFDDHLVAARQEVIAWASRRHDRHQAEDIAQNAVLRTLQAARRGSAIARGSSGEVAAYVQTAARSAAVEVHRRRGRDAPAAGAGWFADPVDDSGRSERYWNGSRWTDAVRHRADGRAASPPPAGVRPQLALASSLDSDAVHESEPAVAAFDLQGMDADELWDRMSALSPRQAAALRKWTQGFTYLDIARELGITPGAANTLLVHARNRMRALLAGD